ncbi:galactose-1-phosphate uridylyltransferase [Micromonosporaceae bacterium Da 78-11]
MPLAYVLDDPALQAKSRKWVEAVLGSQRPDGQFGPGSNDDWWPRMVAVKVLVQHADATGDPRVAPFLERYFRFQLRHLPERPLADWGQVRGADNVLSVLWLHERTGDDELLELARLLLAQTADWHTFLTRDLTGEPSSVFSHLTHGPNVAMGLKTPAVSYLVDGDEAHRDRTPAMLARLDRLHGLVHGVFSGDEWLGGRDPHHGVETCQVVELMFTLEQTARIFGEARYGDLLEQVAFNLLPASCDPRMLAHQYHQQANQVLVSVAQRDWTFSGDDANMFGLEPHFGCCTANLHQGWPKFVRSLWMRTADDGLAAVAYAPCAVTTRLGGQQVRLDVRTAYPFEEDVRVVVDLDTPARFPLRLRIPEWCPDARLVVAGRELPVDVDGRGYVTVDRTWQPGDEVELHLPMRLRVVPRDRGAVGTRLGPLVLALAVGENWKPVADAPRARRMGDHPAGLVELRSVARRPARHRRMADRAPARHGRAVHRRRRPGDRARQGRAAAGMAPARRFCRPAAAEPGHGTDADARHPAGAVRLRPAARRRAARRRAGSRHRGLSHPRPGSAVMTIALTHQVRRTPRRMADGREIIYFDDTAPFRLRTAVDERPLPPAEDVVRGGLQMRRDPLTGEWIAMAAHRNGRTFLPPADLDPLAPTVPGGFPTEIAESDYDVVVFENRFPSFSPRVEGEPGLVDGDPLWPVRPAAGRTEVVCFSAEQHGSFGSLSPYRARTVIEAWADRTVELGRMPGVEHVFIFENRGREIGVTLPHPHGQIYAFPFVAPKAARMLEMAGQHRRATGRNLFRDILDAERRTGSRVVLSSEHWTAYVPAAARWPIEVHLAPHRDVADLPALTGAERDDLARMYLDVLGRLDRFFPGPEPLPYIAGVHQAPVRTGRDEFRLHLQVFSVLRAPNRVKYLAGVESAMGAWISDTTPEQVAARLREVG